MATMREKKPGVWEVRVFTGTDARGKPTQTSRTVRGTKRDAERLAASLEVGAGQRVASRPQGLRRARRVDRSEPRHVGAGLGARSTEPRPVDQEGQDCEDPDRSAVDRRCRALAHATPSRRHAGRRHPQPTRRAERSVRSGAALGLGQPERRGDGATQDDEETAQGSDVARRRPGGDRRRRVSTRRPRWRCASLR